jgi:hypothetical protein
MRTPRHSAAAAVALLCLSVSDGADAEVSASKRLLIRGLIELSGGAGVPEQVEELFLAQIRYALDLPQRVRGAFLAAHRVGGAARERLGPAL